MKPHPLFPVILSAVAGLFFSSAALGGISPTLIEPVEVTPPDRVRLEVGIYSETDRQLHDAETGPDQFSVTGFNPVKISLNPGLTAARAEFGAVFGHFKENYEGGYTTREESLGPFIYFKNQFSPYLSLAMGVGTEANSNELLAHSSPYFSLNIPFKIPLSPIHSLYGESGIQLHSTSPDNYDNSYANTVNYGLGIKQLYPRYNSRVFLELAGRSAPLENNKTYNDLLKITAGGQFPLEALFFHRREGTVTPYVSHGLEDGSPDVAFGVNFILDFVEPGQLP